MIWRYAIGVIVAGILGLWSGLRSSGTEEPRDSKGIDYTSQEFGRRSTFRKRGRLYPPDFDGPV
jgi:hypothetical protein